MKVAVFMVKSSHLAVDDNPEIINIAKLVYAIFIFSYYFLMMSTFRELPISSTVRLPLLLVEVILFAFLIILRPQQLQTLLWQAGLLLLAIGYWYIGRELYILLLAVLLIALPYNESGLRQFLKFDLYLKIGAVLLLYFLSTRGFIENNYLLTADRLGMTLNKRFAFGFSHPNQFGAVLGSICMQWLYVARKKIGPVILTLPIMLLVFRYSGSRTALLSYGLFLVIYPLCCWSKTQQLLQRFRGLSWVITQSYTWAFLSSIYLIYLYRSQQGLAIWLNQVLSGRIELAAAYLRIYGVKLWPHANQAIVDTQTSIWSTLDNQYMHMLVTYGLVTTIVFLWLMQRLLRYLIRRQYYGLLAVCFVFAVSGLMEFQQFVLTINFSWLALSLSARYKVLEPKPLVQQERGL